MKTYEEIREQFDRARTQPAKPVVIGLMGYARSGKDTVAEFLAHHGYERRAFADGVRSLAYLTDPSIAYLVDKRGWEGAKSSPSVRGTLQNLGVACREVFGEDVWVDLALRDLPRLTVVTDVRFPNEAAAIRAKGGVLWRVIRSGTGPVNDHISETALDDTKPDVLIRNNGSLADLKAEVDRLVLDGA